MLVVVAAELALRQARGQIKELKFQADAALHERQYDVAISQIEEALRLDPSSSELANAWNRCAGKKQARKGSRDICKQADGAHPRRFRGGAGDYHQGVDLDKRIPGFGPRMRLWCSSVRRRRGWQKTGSCLDSARSEMEAGILPRR